MVQHALPRAECQSSLVTHRQRNSKLALNPVRMPCVRMCSVKMCCADWGYETWLGGARVTIATAPTQTQVTLFRFELARPMGLRFPTAIINPADGNGHNLYGPKSPWDRCRTGTDAGLGPMPDWDRCRTADGETSGRGDVRHEVGAVLRSLSSETGLRTRSARACA